METLLHIFEKGNVWQASGECLLLHPVSENSSLYLIAFSFLFSSLHSLDALKINCSIPPRDRLQMELTNLF